MLFIDSANESYNKIMNVFYIELKTELSDSFDHLRSMNRMMSIQQWKKIVLEIISFVSIKSTHINSEVGRNNTDKQVWLKSKSNQNSFDLFNPFLIGYFAYIP